MSLAHGTRQKAHSELLRVIKASHLEVSAVLGVMDKYLEAFGDFHRRIPPQDHRFVFRVVSWEPRSVAFVQDGAESSFAATIATEC